MTKRHSTREVGSRMEDLAAAYFKRRRYKILERNFRAPTGEIDMILEKQSRLIFVEVKARSSTRFGLPQEAVTPHKQGQIIRTAQWYLQKKGWQEREAQFDVLAVTFTRYDEPVFEHIPFAFETG